MQAKPTRRSSGEYHNRTPAFSQEELLAEAARTELANLASLEMLVA